MGTLTPCASWRTCQVDVVPVNRGYMFKQSLVNRSPMPTQAVDREVNGVPKDNGGDDEVESPTLGFPQVS
jgi:hypothetical protein